MRQAPLEHQHYSRDQQEDKHQLAEAGLVEAAG
jgi:hypothetical protein